MDSFIYFIKSNYDLLFKCAEVLAAIIGIFLFKKYKNDNAAKLFIYFLIYVNVVETIGSYTNILRGYPDDNWIKLAFKNTILSFGTLLFLLKIQFLIKTIGGIH